MKKFIKKIIWFLLPFLAILTVPSYILFSYSESFINIDALILNKEQKKLIGYAHNENNYKYLKWKTVESSDRADVMVLGSSRVLQFRSTMFTSSFYNAGYTINNVEDFQLFFNSIPKNKYPKILLIGLDQWIFNPNWNNYLPIKNSNHWKSSFSVFPKGNVLFKTYADLFKGKVDFTPPKDTLNNSIIKIGMNAHINNKGFRNDGSMMYGTQINKLLNKDIIANDFNFNNTLGRIKKGKNPFEYGDRFNENIMSKLDSFLNFCSKNDVFVVAISPPFANRVYSEMSNSLNYMYLDYIESECSNLFKNYKYEYYNISHNNVVDLNDDGNIDGFHGGEVVYLKMLIHILENDSKLNKYSNLIQLNKDLKSPVNPYLVYPY